MEQTSFTLISTKLPTELVGLFEQIAQQHGIPMQKAVRQAVAAWCVRMVNEKADKDAKKEIKKDA